MNAIDPENPLSAYTTKVVTGGAHEIVLIDDDELSLAVLALVAASAGFAAECYDTGEAALAAIKAGAPSPSLVLADMQMPGISGNDLAAQLREVCGTGTRLIAMSGSMVPAGKTALFDGFLLKPFSAAELQAASSKPVAQANGPAIHSQAEVLSDRVYQNFAQSMPPAQLAALYRMCLDDAQKRLELMRHASAEGDDAAYRRAAHAVKGGCAMVGALELAGIAAAMETHGLAGESGDGPGAKPFEHFQAAHARLERMLDNKVSSAQDNPAAVVRSL